MTQKRTQEKRIGKWIGQCRLIIAIALLSAMIIVSSISAGAVVVGNPKKQTGPPPMQAGVNPFKESLVSSHSANAGWRVAKGKIGDIWYHPGEHRGFGNEKTILPGLSGIVQEKPKITLREKANIKHQKIIKESKYQSLVDALKEVDSQKQKTGRRR